MSQGMTVTESQSDLVSVETIDSGSSHSNVTMASNSRQWQREKRLLLAVILLSAVAVGLLLGVVVLSSSSSSSSAGVCMTPGCISHANMILQNMDTEADPCQDFYQFSCGGFEEKVKIPDDRTSRSQFSIIDDKLVQQLREILEEEGAEDESHVFRMARDSYKACMDTDKIESLGLAPLKSMLHDLGGWPVLEPETWDEAGFSWIELVYRFRRHGYSPDYLIDFSVVTDSKNSTWRVIDIDQASLGLAREYLVKGLDEDRVASYYNYMVNVAVLLGADRATAEDQLRQSLLFEIELARASQARENRRNSTRLYNPMTIAELQRHTPMVPWLDYINNILTEDLIQVEETERVVVDEPGYLKNLTKLLPATSNRTIANYMMWRAARASLGYFGEDARKIQLAYAKNITGKKTETPRWRSCTGAASGSFGSPVGSMYVKNHFHKSSKEKMLEMVNDIRSEFDRILDSIDWMDAGTRKMAKGKLSTIKEYIGYPEEIMVDSNLEELYEGLHINDNNHFQNGINMSIWGTNYAWGKLREKVDKTDWKRHGQPAVVNAFYSAIENSIQFPAGILQGNFFDADRPAYMNYGGIGWVIGHEITHGFDDRGSQFDKNGNLADWWQQKTKDNFLDRANCIIWQYGNYTHPLVNKTLNGINTQGENIADNGGIKETYRAYENWERRHGEEQRLPGLQDYSAKQMFWISAANTWCSKYRNKALESRIKTGAHSPGRFRVQGPFSNSREFANDFRCPLGSPMNPAKKCEVW